MLSSTDVRMLAKARRTSTRDLPCPHCKRFFGSLAHHFSKSPACKAHGDGLICQPVETGPEEEKEKENDELLSLLNDANACDVAHSLASLKFERNFQRPDIDAAKRLAGVAALRTRTAAFPVLQPLLRDDVNRADFEAGASNPQSVARFHMRALAGSTRRGHRALIFRGPPSASPSS